MSRRMRGGDDVIYYKVLLLHPPTPREQDLPPHLITMFVTAKAYF